MNTYKSLINMNTKENFSTIKVGLFFDGTGNNGYNSTAINPIDEGSYHASPSNIFRLYNNYRHESFGNTNMLAVYVEGIGTLTYQEDSYWNQATGDWSRYYGGSSKISFALEGIHQELTQLFNYNTYEKEVVLEFNIFGFSRGAALARHFANQLTKVRSDVYNKISSSLSKSQKSLKGVVLNFIGLYDTVESFLQGKFDTSTSDLNANCVYHLRAMHECRKNFPFTSIFDKKTSENADKTGGGFLVNKNFFELYVPGCHADIGGGYLNHLIEQTSITCTYTEKGSREEVASLQKNKLWEKLIDNKNISYYNYPTPGFSYAISKRTDVQAELQWAYALLMLDTAVQFGCPFNKEAFFELYRLPADLRDFFTALQEKNELLINKKSIKALNQDVIDRITQQYIHISANWDYISHSQIGPSTEPLKYTANDDSAAQNELTANLQASARVNEPEKNWIRTVKYQK